MGRVLDWFVFMLSPARWPTVPRRAFVVLLPIGALYLLVGWVLLCAVMAVAAVTLAVLYALSIAIVAPALWCREQVYRLWTGART